MMMKYFAGAVMGSFRQFIDFLCNFYECNEDYAILQYQKYCRYLINHYVKKSN